MSPYAKKRLQKVASYSVPLGFFLIGAIAIAGTAEPHSGNPEATATYFSVAVSVAIGVMSSLVTAMTLLAWWSWKASRWATRIEDRVDGNTQRLAEGAEEVKQVPMLVQRIDHLIGLMEKTRGKVDQMGDEYVSGRECDLLHSGMEKDVEGMKKWADEKMQEFDGRIKGLEADLAEVT